MLEFRGRCRQHHVILDVIPSVANRKLCLQQLGKENCSLRIASVVDDVDMSRVNKL